jgi:cephalosporin hydroxylase
VTLTGVQQAQIEHRIMHGTSFLGVPAFKNPMDAWVYQEIIYETRPDVIVEVGNAHGGSLLYLESVCELVGHGEVVGVDVSRDRWEAGTHRRMTLVTGDAVEAFPQVAEIVGCRKTLVIEDSDHGYEHTLSVLRTYAPLVQPGGYLICEDGVMPPVAAALKAFLAEHDEFEVDWTREWPVTWNPGGYLRRRR